MTNLARTLAEIRTEHGWSFQNAAIRIGIDVRTLRRIEGGEIQPTVLTLSKIARAYGRRLPELMEACE